MQVSLLEICEKKERAELKVTELEKYNKSLRDENRELRARVKDLERENAKHIENATRLSEVVYGIDVAKQIDTQERALFEEKRQAKQSLPKFARPPPPPFEKIPPHI